MSNEPFIICDYMYMKMIEVCKMKVDVNVNKLELTYQLVLKILNYLSKTQDVKGTSGKV